MFAQTQEAQMQAVSCTTSRGNTKKTLLSSNFAPIMRLPSSAIEASATATADLLARPTMSLPIRGCTALEALQVQDQRQKPMVSTISSSKFITTPLRAPPALGNLKEMVASKRRHQAAMTVNNQRATKKRKTLGDDDERDFVEAARQLVNLSMIGRKPALPSSLESTC